MFACELNIVDVILTLLSSEWEQKYFSIQFNEISRKVPTICETFLKSFGPKKCWKKWFQK